MSSSKEIINQHLTRNLTEIRIQLHCDHVWTLHAYGYECDKCKYYTGLNKELNMTIGQEIGSSQNSLFNILGRIMKPK